MDHEAKDGPGDEDGVEHGREDVIVDTEMNGVEEGNGNGSYSKYDYRAGIGGDGEGY